MTMEFKEPPIMTQREEKHWDYTEVITELNGMPYKINRTFHRNDAYANLYDFGVRKEVGMSKVKVPKLVDTSFKIGTDTFIMIVGLFYGGCILIPIMFLFNGFDVSINQIMGIAIIGGIVMMISGHNRFISQDEFVIFERSKWIYDKDD